MKKIFIVYGHYNEKSFNAAIRDTFIDTVKKIGHSVDVVDLYKEKFDPVYSGEEPDHKVLDYRKRIEGSNAIVLIAAILTNNKSKISCSSRVTPYDTYSSIFFSKRWILKIIMKLVMYRANILSCVSKDMVQQYKNIFANSRHLPIYNIVKDDHSKKLILVKLINMNSIAQ